MRHFNLVASVVTMLSIVVVGVMAAAPGPAAMAQARHSIVYRGTTREGRFPGPPLVFTVAANGRRMTNFKNLHSSSGRSFGEAGACGGIWFGQPGNLPAPPIVINRNRSFFGKIAGTFDGFHETTTVSGRFAPNGRRAVGRIVFQSLATKQVSGCHFTATFVATAAVPR